MRLVFDPRVGLKKFITSLKNLFNPTPVKTSDYSLDQQKEGSNWSHQIVIK